MNVRHIQTTRQPLCIVLDSQLRMPASSAVLNNSRVLWVHAGKAPPSWLSAHPNAHNIELLCCPSPAGNASIDLPMLLQQLAMREVNELHVEAGQRLNGAWLQSGLVDEVVQYLAPIFLGPGMGLAALPTRTQLPNQDQDKTQSSPWVLHSNEKIGPDLKVIWTRP
jgi:diaminohydroxyphosphoribosylaminopyrimidine deaminase/5-amino-6-(5-phosphoribosylamino)uracil reductase